MKLTIDAVLSDIGSDARRIVTIGHKTEHPSENIMHIEVDAGRGQTLDSALHSPQAQDADVLVLPEIRDHETAHLACVAAISDCLVLTSIDAPDSISGLFHVLDLGVKPPLVCKTVTAVLSQRQIRTLCERCKEPYKPKPEFLQKANLPTERINVFYRPPKDPQVRCGYCDGTGYHGTTGIFELLVTNDRMRELLNEEYPSMISIKEEARKSGMLYLEEDGLRQVIRGVTAVSELVRVLRE